jgi:curved DNA-binding protein
VKTHYDILEVPQTATSEQIRKAFRSMAFMYHPDLTVDDTDPGMFIRIREAYETLIDDNARHAYDEELAEVIRQKETRAREAAKFVSVERPKTRQVYSPRYTEQRLAKPFEAEMVNMNTIERRSSDVFGSMEISLEETLKPSTFTIIMPEDTDSAAKGRLLIRLPGRIHRDAVLRVRGQGARAGGERGDLFIEVIFAQHASFRLCAESLFYDLPVQPWQAALGFEATVPTLEGFERVAIPPLISSPCIRRLEGQGIYKPNGERSDLWINLKLEVPPPTSYRARRLWAELAEEYRHRGDRS